MEFLELVDICLKADLPMVIYRLPGKDEILLVISKSNVEKISFTDLKQKENGFVLHPFKDSDKKPILFIKEDLVLSSKEKEVSPVIIDFIDSAKPEYVGSEFSKENIDLEKKDYLSKIESLVKRINKGDLMKVVFSRTKTIKPFEKTSLKDLFFKMEDRYSDAFVFLVNVPGEFSWCGATPELLLKRDNNNFKTVALAGTQLFEGGDVSDIKWENKDIEEQNFVCLHVEEQIKNAGLSYTKSEPFTAKAGGVVHIKTEYSINGTNDKFWDLVGRLHPTPAVCGTPMRKSLAVIEEAENYDRAYYSGFLGPIENQSEIKLFVNLRCAKFINESLCLYVGGGITGQSVPEKEWKETEFKAETLKKLL